MSEHVFVVSEWLAKESHENALKAQFKKLLAHTLKHEPDCVSARVTHQVAHPGSPTQSKFTIVLMQEYINIEAFDNHCSKDYVSDFFKIYIEHEKTGIVEDWQCRLFTEDK
jgi:quinol monooxygenase YgiN